MFSGGDGFDDITLEKIDYEWIQGTNKVPRLRRALKLLVQDGSYFVDLIQAIEQKISVLDASQSTSTINKVNPVPSKDTKKEQKKQEADEEKIKGNQALQSNDLKQALTYYSKSIEIDPSLAASYCNRALVYLKLNKYQECVKDCDDTIRLDSRYLKAYHRRAKANFLLNHFAKAYKDYKYILKIQQDYEGIQGELDECCKHMTEADIKMADNAVAFKTDDQQPIQVDFRSLSSFKKELQSIEDIKQSANIEIKKGMYNVAIDILMDSLRTCWKIFEQLQNPQDITTIKVLRCTILSNIGLCYMHSGEHKRVIEYCDTLLEDESHLSNSRELVVKVYLRRALAYESLEKLIKSKLDFTRVKHLDAGNLTASKGLDRIRKTISKEENDEFTKQEQQLKIQVTIIQKNQQQQLEVESQNQSQQESSTDISQQQESKQQVQQESQPQVQQEPIIEKVPVIVVDSRTLNEQLIELKDQGNQFYKEKKITEAIMVFSQGSLVYERSNPNNQKLAQTTYINILTNHCLCLSTQNSHQQVIDLSTRVLLIDPNNLKAHYRRALAIINLVDEKEKTLVDTLASLEEVNDMLEKSRKDLEKITYLDKDNKQAADKLKEVQHRNIVYRLKLNEMRPPQVKIVTNETPEEIIEKQTQQKQKSMITQNLSKAKLDQITTNLSEALIEQLLKSPKPESSSQFETNMKMIKTEKPQILLDYMTQIDVEVFKNLYSNKELPSDIFVQILMACKSQSDQIDQVLGIIKLLPQMKKFEFSLKMLTKKEKIITSEIIDALNLQGDELQDIKKVYKL